MIHVSLKIKKRKSVVSGKRKEIVVVPTEGPTVSLVTEEGNESTYDAATKTITINNVQSQTIKLQVIAEDRGEDTAISYDNTGTTWLTADETSKTATKAEFVLTLASAQTNGTIGTIKFKSDKTNTETTINVVLKDVEIP